MHLFITCTLKHSPEVSDTQALGDISIGIMARKRRGGRHRDDLARGEVVGRRGLRPGTDIAELGGRQRGVLTGHVRVAAASVLSGSWTRPSPCAGPPAPDQGARMEHRPLGRTGVSVSKLCLGAMMFGAWGEPDHDESIRIIHRALDAGVNFVDTADVYSAGESEVIVGKALHGRRDDVILATKLYMPIGEDPDPNRRGTSRRWIIQEVESSLRRLGTDWIDLYQVHRPTPETDLEETLGTLSDLVHQGKVRYIGHSTYPASLIVEAQWTARDRRLQRFVTEQPPYSILTRGIEAEVLPACRRYGMGVIPWSPLQGGWLSGRYRKGTDVAGPASAARRRLVDRYDLSLPENQRKLDAAEQLAQLAEEAGITLIQLALAFVLNHPAVTAPIIGPRTMEHLESQLTAADVVLDEAVLDRIDEIVPPGTSLNPADAGWQSPALQPAARRR
jgi:aryl-alcohol dehydrogenase-like predicted oxidoreductase